MDALNGLLYGFSVALSPVNLLAALGGAFLGTLVGVLPGLGPMGAMAMLLSTTLAMKPETALIMLAGLYYGAMYGGSTTSILLNVPGESTSVVTCLDGYQMAKRGRAGAALSISAIGSFVAGTLGVVGVMLFAPSLANMAIAFSGAGIFPDLPARLDRLLADFRRLHLERHGQHGHRPDARHRGHASRLRHGSLHLWSDPR